jgi:hypothetical protein
VSSRRKGTRNEHRSMRPKSNRKKSCEGVNAEQLRSNGRGKVSDLGGKTVANSLIRCKSELGIVAKFSPLFCGKLEVLFQDRLGPVVIEPQSPAVNSSFAAGCAPIGKDVER